MSSEGLSLRDLVMEIRREVSGLRNDFQNFKEEVVYKEDLDLWNEIRRNTKRWAIGTIVSMAMLILAAVSIIVNAKGG